MDQAYSLNALGSNTIQASGADASITVNKAGKIRRARRS